MTGRCTAGLLYVALDGEQPQRALLGEEPGDFEILHI